MGARAEPNHAGATPGNDQLRTTPAARPGTRGRAGDEGDQRCGGETLLTRKTTRDNCATTLAPNRRRQR
eukprot:11220662-Lingulodinium_polyedra.AAC.1